MDYYDITKGRKEAIMQRVYEYHREKLNNINWTEDPGITELRNHCCKYCKKYKKSKHNFDVCTECGMFKIYLIYLYNEWQKYQ